MNVTLSVEHPAWAYQFKHIIKSLQENGHNVNVLLVDKDNARLVLEKHKIPYILLANGTGNNFFQKGFLFLLLTVTYLFHSKNFQTDVFIGRASPMLAVAAFILRKPHYIFEDTEVSSFSLKFCQFFSTKIITPLNFLKVLGPKQERRRIFKELFYLHPTRFTPDSNIKKKYNIDWNKKVILLRYIAWNASHDFGHHKLSKEQKIEIINHLHLKGYEIIISTENSNEFSDIPNLHRIDFSDMHQILHFVDLYVGEGASMASEAVILGTPALYLNPIKAGSIETQKASGLLLQITEYSHLKEIEAGIESLLCLSGDTERLEEKYNNLMNNLEDPHLMFMDLILHK